MTNDQLYPEFKSWKAEAEYWDQTDASFMLEEEGEWVGPGVVRAAPDLCRQPLSVSVDPKLLRGDCQIPALGLDLAIQAEQDWSTESTLHSPRIVLY
jgi:hypothetical protein